MKDFTTSLAKKLRHLCSCSCLKMSCFFRTTSFLLIWFYRCVLLRVNSFLAQLFYFVFLSLFGFQLLKFFEPRSTEFRPRDLDMFFTSVSAVTISSMSTVEMEVFSNTQLVVLTVLMFIGGEIFTSMLGLHLRRSKLRLMSSSIGNSPSLISSSFSSSSDQIELGIVKMPAKPEFQSRDTATAEHLEYSSLTFLNRVVFGYFVVIQAVGLVFVSAYLTLVSSAKRVLKNKGLNQVVFSIFTTVSTFAGCGFLPTNENMIPFSKNPGLLMILIPQTLLGNTLFPTCLRFLIWFLGKYAEKKKEVEANYLLENTPAINYFHLLPSLHSSYLLVTVLGFILVQSILFWSLEWNSAALTGLSPYQKVVGVLFQTVNTRHTGESIIDLSVISPALLVLFVVMMYLPAYTSFRPLKADEDQFPPECGRSSMKKSKRGIVAENLILSQLSYLVLFIILICITERASIKEDPLNFSVLNIIVEVTSAYGNVGFSTGYSCQRRLKPDANCTNKWYGFSGKWSDEGKVILIVVMFLGRLKRFNTDRGRAWKLL